MAPFVVPASFRLSDFHFFLPSIVLPAPVAALSLVPTPVAPLVAPSVIFPTQRFKSVLVILGLSAVVTPALFVVGLVSSTGLALVSIKFVLVVIFDVAVHFLDLVLVMVQLSK